MDTQILTSKINQMKYRQNSIEEKVIGKLRQINKLLSKKDSGSKFWYIPSLYLLNGYENKIDDTFVDFWKRISEPFKLKKLLFKDNAEDFLLWMNKEADEVDIDTIFSFLDKRSQIHPFIMAVKKK